MNLIGRWSWYDDLLRRYLPASPSAPVSASSAQMQTQEHLVAYMTQSGFGQAEVQSDTATFPYTSPEEWWQERWSLFFRGALESLSPSALGEFQAEALARAREMQAHDQLITQLTALYTPAS